MLPNWLLDLLLDLSKCTNSQTQKNGLLNYNLFNIFAFDKLLEELWKRNRRGDYYDMSNPKKIFDDKLLDLLREFDYLICNGGLPGYDKINKMFNPPGISVPPGTSDQTIADIIAIIEPANNGLDWITPSGPGGDTDPNRGREGLIDTAWVDDGYTNLPPGTLPGTHIDLTPPGMVDPNKNADGNGGSGGDGTLNGGDKSSELDPNDNNGNDRGNGNGNGDGSLNGNNGDGNGNNGRGEGNGPITIKNPLGNIPIKVYEDIDKHQRAFKCFVPQFFIETYTPYPLENEPPLVITPKRIENIRRVHDEILLPIFNYYYGPDATPSCQIRIVLALGTYQHCNLYGGNAFSKHMTGEAVDFTMVGITYETLIKDIKEGKIDINFGYIAPTNGIHITLPFEFEGLEVRNMIVDSPHNGLGSLTVEFL